MDAVLAALGGAVFGFWMRWGEFRRQQRYDAYTGFLRHFLALSRIPVGDDARLPGEAPDPADDEDGTPHPETSDRPETLRLVDDFREDAIRIRLVGTKRVLTGAKEIEQFAIDQLIPIRVGTTERVATPAEILLLERKAFDLASDLAHTASRDMVGVVLPF